MAVREILVYPEQGPALRRKSEEVQGVDRGLRRLIRDLVDTLLDHPEGVGLAAPQVNAHRRVVVVRLGSGSESSEGAGPPIPILNPSILEAGEERRDFDGCLSFPGLYGETIRPHHLRVAGLDPEGKPFDRVFDGFDAVLVHHELDHLDGVLFIDRIERLEDLYRVQVDETGRQLRETLSAESLWRPDPSRRGLPCHCGAGHIGRGSRGVSQRSEGEVRRDSARGQ
jgi:peptide deformylase